MGFGDLNLHVVQGPTVLFYIPTCKKKKKKNLSVSDIIKEPAGNTLNTSHETF